jgi:hypothetical protein
MVGFAFTVACYSYIDGSRTKKRTIEKLHEIEIMNRALGDMPAVSTSVMSMLQLSIVLVIAYKMFIAHFSFS